LLAGGLLVYTLHCTGEYIYDDLQRNKTGIQNPFYFIISLLLSLWIQIECQKLAWFCI
jgi:hypothetical protein